MTTRTLLLCFLAAGISTAAAEPAVRRAIPVEPSAVPAAPAGRVSVNDQARFLAGVPGDAGSPLKPLEDSAAWQEHQREFDELWFRVQKARHAVMRNWSLQEILPRTGQPKAIYYMFGGPDFVTPQVFFPGTPVFILGGLEPVGQVPDLRTLSSDQLLSSLRNLRRSMDGLLRLGFFETKDMRADLNRTPVQGVKPIVYAMMVRNGLRLVGESYFTLGANGAPSYSDGLPKGSVKGLKITFEAVSGGAIRTFFYLDGDISNGAQDKRIQSFLARHKPAGSYLKAASYLMHGEGFSSIRNFLLNNSSFILQDDSGIPLRHLDRAKWDLVLFGNYRGVMPVFGKHFQPDLRTLYQASGGRPMPFGLGYRTSDEQASQVLAIPK